METRLTIMIEQKMENMTTTSSSRSNLWVMFYDFCSNKWILYRGTVLANLENLMVKFMKQIGQLVKIFSERTLGTLPRNTEVNPREHDISTKKEVMNVQKRDCREEEERSWNIMEINVVDLKEDERKRKSTSVEYKPKVPFPEALVRDLSLTMQETSPKWDKKSKKPKEKGKHLIPKKKGESNEMGPVWCIEKENPKKYSDFRDSGGALGT
ncbi:hypothetical protein M9H77_18782 [Catharanthus roseus]|uniref:Uncharacterized protein n=1 Tax=Catharanthus roseus TaxID=4058 RepID=A0ACC0B8D1_CATRO|nr:hypothetical protein M9H77_18782 [Catharanthus roseus]